MPSATSQDTPKKKKEFKDDEFPNPGDVPVSNGSPVSGARGPGAGAGNKRGPGGDRQLHVRS